MAGKPKLIPATILLAGVSTFAVLLGVALLSGSGTADQVQGDDAGVAQTPAASTDDDATQ